MILKQPLQQRLVTLHAYFFKKVEKIYVELCSLKGRFNKVEIYMVSENESQLKRIRKPPLLLSQEKCMAEKVILPIWQNVKKRSKKETFFEKFSLAKTLALFSRFEYFFFWSFKNKINIMLTLPRPSWFQLSKFV